MSEMHEPDPPRKRYTWAEPLATTVLATLLLYLLMVLVLDTRVAGVALNFRTVVLCSLVAAAGLRFGIRRWVARRVISRDTLLNVSLLGGTLLTSFLAADLAVSAYLGLVTPSTDLEALALADKNPAVMELYPRLYYPTEKNFRLHKPGVSITGSHYGDLYLPPMLQSPTLVDSVLNRRRVRININDLGYRETSPPATCGILTLGDSFTFGWGVSDGLAWPDLLEQRLGRCVYNLGIHDASPMQELLLLEHFLSRPGQVSPSRLVWAIYEGNDLEDSYAELSPTDPPSRYARATRGTILEIETPTAWLYRVRTQSIVHRLRTGELRLTSSGARQEGRSRYEIDGVKLVNPLFHSPQLGFMLLHSHLLTRAAQSREYVLSHPNRTRLDEVFARMARLGDSLRFSVSVVILPSSVRLYAPYFPLTPAPSAEPHFVNYVEDLARTSGFDVVNFLNGFQPYARKELLYFRDDDHLNERGHEVVATVLADHLARAGSR